MLSSTGTERPRPGGRIEGQQFCQVSRIRVFHSGSFILPTFIWKPIRSGQASAACSCATRVRNAFARVIDIANDRNADLLLIVGDLFDSARVSEEGLAFAMETIGRARMPVVMIPGNHDAHDERSIYAGLAPGAMPENLHLILEPEGRTIDFPELATRVWGRALVEHTPDYRPLSGVPERQEGLWNIALAHGFFMEEGEIERSSPITPAEIERSRYDYVALGHVHVLGDVSQGSTPRLLLRNARAALFEREFRMGAVGQLRARPARLNRTLDGARIRLTTRISARRRPRRCV